MLSYSIGPLTGQIRAAMVASATSLSVSVTSGGFMCVIFVAILAILLPTFRKYDVETNEFAISEREKRKNLENWLPLSEISEISEKFWNFCKKYGNT